METLESDSSTRDRIVHLVVEEGPVSVLELARDLRLTTAGVRRHIAALEDAGQVVVHTSPVAGAPGRGRPARRYVATRPRTVRPGLHLCRARGQGPGVPRRGGRPRGRRELRRAPGRLSSPARWRPRSSRRGAARRGPRCSPRRCPARATPRRCVRCREAAPSSCARATAPCATWRRATRRCARRRPGCSRGCWASTSSGCRRSPPAGTSAPPTSRCASRARDHRSGHALRWPPDRPTASAIATRRPWRETDDCTHRTGDHPELRPGDHRVHRCLRVRLARLRRSPACPRAAGCPRRSCATSRP